MEYRPWLESHGITIERKLIYETAFDGVVKVYLLRTKNEQINQLLKDNYFGDFGYRTSKGVLLRKFKNKTSWPKTRLAHLDLANNTLKELLRTRSSWNTWTVQKLDDLTYEVSVSPNKAIKVKID